MVHASYAQIEWVKQLEHEDTLSCLKEMKEVSEAIRIGGMICLKTKRHPKNVGLKI